jgi:hypothetical protein
MDRSFSFKIPDSVIILMDSMTGKKEAEKKMLRLYSIQVSFGYIFSFARLDSFGHIYTTILLKLICSRKGHFRPELPTHPDNAGYTQT